MRHIFLRNFRNSALIWPKNSFRDKVQFIIWQALTLILLLLGQSCSKSDLQDLKVSSIAAKPEVFTLKIQNYNSLPANSFQQIFVSNFSVNPVQGQLHYSTARDGLYDDLKSLLNPSFGFLNDTPESVVIGFEDFIIFNLGVKSVQQNLLYCGANLMQTTSLESFVYSDSRLGGSPQQFLGLRDCEKIYMGFSPTEFDNDNDGIPDYLEMRCGLNPLDANDANLSAGFDGISNLEKCRTHIPVAESATTPSNKLFAYQYGSGQNPDGSRDFTISNIPIMNGGADNFIAIYIIEKNLTTGKTAIFTAFSILNGTYSDRILITPYWVKPNDSSTFNNQGIVAP